jgi:hypothetical protein
MDSRREKTRSGKLIETKLPACALCNEPVQLETSKTDEDGKAIHEECYVRKLRSERPKMPTTLMPATLRLFFRDWYLRSRPHRRQQDSSYTSTEWAT